MDSGDFKALRQKIPPFSSKQSHSTLPSLLVLQDLPTDCLIGAGEENESGYFYHHTLVFPLYYKINIYENGGQVLLSDDVSYRGLLISFPMIDLTFMMVMLLFMIILYCCCKNAFKLLSYLSNVTILTMWILVLVNSWGYLFTTHESCANEKQILLLFYLIHTPRVFITFCIIMYYSFSYPCILYKIVRNRREQRRTLHHIGGSRGQYNLYRNIAGYQSINFSNNRLPSINRAQNSNNHNRPRQDLVRRRYSILQLFRNNRVSLNDKELPLDRLRRLKHQDLTQDFEECSLCIEPFSETPDELLIALHCNINKGNIQDNMHIFHESCILEWLNNHKERLLCRTKITKDGILRSTTEDEIRNY
ncbi:unnamed protein product [Moneuplotes crassus]|uniref:RING-type domain-containing protein n=1 Tax=Euplotes crassus TaxID=5936 RepID=A0AAD1UBZ5_EUPCR|nr:unnamed protein product [Moneuplotes crassus]